MSKLYIDCSMGITAQRLLGALIDLHEDKKNVVDLINNMGFDGLKIAINEEAYKGIRGKSVEFHITADREVELESEDYHRKRARTYDEIVEIIDDLSLSGKIRRQIISIYDMIGEATAAVKGRSKNEIHFNRTGSRDVILSVAGVCMLINQMNFDKIIATPVSVGTGYAYTSLGEMPIPVPVMKQLLENIPYNAGNEEGEMSSLDGIALLKMFAEEFIPLPDIEKEKTGGGFGNREFVNGINCVRVYIGEPVKTMADYSMSEIKAVLYGSEDTVRYAIEKIKELEISDAYIIPIKNLDGNQEVLLTCICENDIADKVAITINNNADIKSMRRSQVLSY